MKRLRLVVIVGLWASVVQADDKPNNPATGYFETFPLTKRVPLDPRIRAELDAAKGPAVFNMTPAEARAWFEKRIASVPKLNDPVAKVDNRTIPGPGGKLPLRVYNPKGQGPFPILL